MISKTKSGLQCLMAVVVVFSARAGEFTPPAEGPVPFRRDRIPLDADAMAALSKQLETLAGGLNAETPEDRRGAAQMLALALALDPANTTARDLITAYQEDHRQPDENLDKLEKSRARIWQLIAWLETPEAGSQGQTLAACLKDVIVISDPKNPKAASIRQKGEQGPWAGWIPPVSAYQQSGIAAANDKESPKDPVNPPAASTPFLLDKAEIQTILWKPVGKGDNPSWVLAPLPLQMTAAMAPKPDDSENENPHHPMPFSVRIGTRGQAGPLVQISASVRNLLRKQFPKLPDGVMVTISSPEFERSVDSGKRQSVSAPAAVLAAASLSGKEPGAIVIGQLDDSGSYKLSTGFWDQLQALGKGNGQRLVLPAESAPFLASILALERPEFFIEYEVLLAADFQQLQELCARKPASPLADAETGFQRIRERQGTQDVRQYIANSFVKQRLSAVLQDAPNHFSAKALLIQAAGSRPTTVSRAVLAAELRRALLPMQPFVKSSEHEPAQEEISKLGEVYDQCRSKVDAMERYAEKGDATLISEARDVVNTLRNLEKATRTRGESYTVVSAINSARVELQKSARAFADKLAAESGDGGPPSSR